MNPNTFDNNNNSKSNGLGTNPSSERKFAAWLVSNRTLLLITTAIVVLISTTGVFGLSFNSDYRLLFNEDNPQLKAYDNLQSNFSQPEVMVFLVAPESGNIFQKESLQLIKQLSADAKDLPYAQGIQAITTFQRSQPQQVDGEDGFVVDFLIPRDKVLDKQTLENIRLSLHNDPMLYNRLVSADDEVSLVVVYLGLPDGKAAMDEVIKASEALNQKYREAYPNATFYILGGLVITDAFLKVALYDAIHLFPFVFALGLIIQGILFRSMSAVLASMIVVGFSIAFAMGIAGWMHVSLNQTSVLAPLLILTLALADSTHIITQYMTLLRLGKDKLEAIEQSLADNMRPIFLTTITTAIGLLCMNFSDSPPFHDFANITALGIAIALVFTLSLLPATLVMLPITPSDKDLNLTKIMRTISRVTVQYRLYFFWISITVVLVTAFYIPKNELNDDLLEYFDEKLEIRQAADFTSAHFNGFQSIDYVLDAGGAQNINSPEFLKKVEQFSLWLKSQPETSQVFSYLDTAKRLNQDMHNGDPAWHKIPDSRELASQYLLLYELSLQGGQDLNDLINHDRSKLKLSVFFEPVKNRELIALETRIKQWLEKELPSLKASGASQSLMFAHLGHQVISSMIEGSLFALALITVVLIIGLRSIRYGLLSLIPNAFPAVITYGLWGMLVGEMNQAAAVTFSVSLGIVVDDTVHILSKYLTAKKQGKTTEQALEFSFTTAGTALVITSLVITAGLVLLAQSVFGINAIMGKMVAPIIVIALIIDFFFLPALLMLVDTKNKVESKSETL